MSTSRRVLVALAAASTGAIAASASAAGTAVTLADTGTPSSTITAEAVAQALRAQGFTVTRSSVPSALAADAALRAGTLDAYATDTATLLERVLGRPKERDTTRLPALVQAVLATRGQVASGIATDDDAPRIACTRTAVRDHKLSRLASLTVAAPRLTYAANAAHVVRADGLASLRVSFRRVIVSPGLGRFDVIGRRKAHCVLSSGTEPRAVRLSLIGLRDPQRRLAGTPAHSVVVANQAYVAGAPAAFGDVAARVAAIQTQTATLSLRTRVELDGQDPAVAVADHLRSAALIP